jgi:tetratricopeptide (TPR) repeat protein
MQRQLCCFISLFLFLASALAAPSATEQSKSTMVSAKPLTSTASPKSKAQRIKVQRDIERYQRAISDLESEEGVYGAQLAEKLSSLGAALQFNDEHDKAIKVFKRAIHLNRINDGLYTTTQMPLLEQQIASHMALGQWQDVTDRYRYLDWINTQNYGKDDPRMLPALNQLGRWHLRAYGMQLGKDRETITNHLIKAHKYIERSIELLDESGPLDEERLIDELNGLTLTNYLFATYQRTAAQKIGSPLPVDPEARHSAMMIDKYINRSFRAGKDAINRVIRIYANSEDAPPGSVAKAKVKMADWLFMFNKRRAAFDLYQEAYQLMTADESDNGQLQATFGNPVALPNLDLMDTNNYTKTEQSEYDPDNNYVLASFDVTPQGKAANIEIIDSKPVDNISARSQVKKSLRIAKFRPRFVGGEPALTEKMQLRVLSR